MYKGSYKASISLCGDLFISRRLLEIKEGDSLFELQRKLKLCDCRFGNLETTVLCKDEGYPELFPGGGYAMTSLACACQISMVRSFL